MLVFERKAALRRYLEQKRGAGSTIGFVPTMGALHKGHLSLIEAAKAQTDLCVCSIFVNPTQFNNPGDLEKYPRSLEQDMALLKSAGCQVLFCPDNEEIYPQETQTELTFSTLEAVMEGYFRPGHFKGVGIIIAKFFNIVRPDRAFFGQKDLQQCRIIQCMNEELFFEVKIQIVPTVREADGLAMSSRNMRLSAGERSLAVNFYRALQLASAKLAEGIQSAELSREVEAYLAQFPGLSLEYFCLADSGTLQPLDFVPAHGTVALCIAGFVGDIRLIDNLLIEV